MFLRRLLFVLPVLIFAGAAFFFWRGLDGERQPDSIPSVLLGKPVPAFDLPPLEGLELPGLASGDLTGQVTLVNFWASWCLPCKAEHPLLVELAKIPGVRLVGIDYKDPPEKARAFLASLGNPFAAIGVDAEGRTGIDWGLSGVPETFIVDAEGKVRFRYVGALNGVDVETKILPVIRSLQP